METAGTISSESRIASTLRIGEELPIFCEQCGYALHGMPQVRCKHCAILQFHCPECGHHQPINTLRPAAQKFLSRIRAGTIVFITVFKIAYFAFFLFLWMVMGSAWSYSYNYNSGRGAYMATPEISNDMLLAFSLYATAFGCVSRMLLLRWRLGWAVGAVLAVLVMNAIFAGAWLELHNRQARDVISPAIFYCALLAGACIVLFAWMVWPIWVFLVRVLMPKRAGDAMLAWQRTLAERKPVNEMKAQVD